MSSLCQRNSHVWYVATRTNHLTPRRGLLSGRRCQCGQFLILSRFPPLAPPEVFLVADVSSAPARVLARAFIGPDTS